MTLCLFFEQGIYAALRHEGCTSDSFLLILPAKQAGQT